VEGERGVVSTLWDWLYNVHCTLYRRYLADGEKQMEGWLSRLEAIVHYLTSLDLHQVGAPQFMSEKTQSKAPIKVPPINYWTQHKLEHQKLLSDLIIFPSKNYRTKFILRLDERPLKVDVSLLI
jgi:hypothetical protein